MLELFTALIAPAVLAQHLDEDGWVVVDCRFTIGQPERGSQDYQKSHIPGAVYAHLDRDLSGPVVPGQTGRHPLPEVGDFVNTLGSWGIGPGIQVVAYDDGSGAYAARLWWMLRWLGHDAVAVLDGGWERWQRDKLPVRSIPEKNPLRVFTPQVRPHLLVSSAEVEAARQDPAFRVFDARSPDRFRGQNETLDPVAGHIPGAVSAPYQDNLDEGQVFKPPQVLRERYLELLEGRPPEQAIFYCGSGVTAAHNLLALAHAGLGEGRLYAGSWSEWITDPRHPTAT